MRAFVCRLVFPTILGLLIVVSLLASRIAVSHITSFSTSANTVPLPITETVLRLPQDSSALKFSATCSGATTWTSTSISLTSSTGAIRRVELQEFQGGADVP
jgi:hypothetical protein